MKSIRLINNDKGMTLIELLVAMAIFLIVTTISVGGFVSLIRLQTESRTMTDVQQNGRIALEQLTRLSRQADKVTITHQAPEAHTDHSTPEATDYIDDITFTIEGEDLLFNVAEGRLQKNNGLTITNDNVVIKKMYFNKKEGIPATLDINLILESKNPSIGTTKDTINLKSSVLLTGLK